MLCVFQTETKHGARIKNAIIMHRIITRRPSCNIMIRTRMVAASHYNVFWGQASISSQRRKFSDWWSVATQIFIVTKTLEKKKFYYVPTLYIFKAYKISDPRPLSNTSVRVYRADILKRHNTRRYVQAAIY